MNTVYNNLKIARQRNNLTQKELAELVGTTASYVSQLETSKHTSSKYLCRIAELLGVPKDILLSTDINLLKSEKSGFWGKDSVIKSGESPKIDSILKSVENPKKEFKPMYAARPNDNLADKEKSRKKATAEAKPDKFLKQATSLTEKGFVQVLTCTANAANKYLENGWELINSRVNNDGSDFLLLLGSVKRVTSEDFQRIKTSAKTSIRSMSKA